MAGKDGGLVGKLRQDVGEAVHQVFIAAALKVGAADAHAEQGVAGEGRVLLGTVEDNAAGRVAGRLQHLQAVVAKADDLVGGEETTYGRIFPAEGSADDALEVTGNIGDDELVFLGCLHLQTVGLVDGVDTKVMVPMAVCGQEATGFQTLAADIVGDGLTFVVIIGTAVDDDTVECLVTYYVGVLLKQVEWECFDGQHGR